MLDRESDEFVEGTMCHEDGEGESWSVIRGGAGGAISGGKDPSTGVFGCPLEVRLRGRGDEEAMGGKL